MPALAGGQLCEPGGSRCCPDVRDPRGAGSNPGRGHSRTRKGGARGPFTGSEAHVLLADVRDDGDGGPDRGSCRQSRRHGDPGRSSVEADAQRCAAGDRHARGLCARCDRNGLARRRPRYRRAQEPQVPQRPYHARRLLLDDRRRQPHDEPLPGRRERHDDQFRCQLPRLRSTAASMDRTSRASLPVSMRMCRQANRRTASRATDV